MHVIMTYPANMALRGGDWAAAARRGGASVTEIVLTETLEADALPTVPWLAQQATQRYEVEIPATRKTRKRRKLLYNRLVETAAIAAGQHGPIDLLHTHDAGFAPFADALATSLNVPHMHNEPADSSNLGEDIAAVLDTSDAIRIARSSTVGHNLPDAYRDRLATIPTPIDFSIEGAIPTFTAIEEFGSALTLPGQPWLAAISPRKIVWRGDLGSPEAIEMVDTFADLRLTGTQLEMVGTEDGSQILQELAGKLGLDGRILVRTGATPRELAAVISDADLLIIALEDARLEREAMTALVLGTPVIAPPTGVYPELITSELGALVSAGDASAMIAAVRRVTMVDVYDELTMAALAGRHGLAAVGGVLVDLYHRLTNTAGRSEGAGHITDADTDQIAS